MKREKTKYKGIYKVGEVYYVTYYDGSTKVSKNGIPYFGKAEKRIGRRLGDAIKFKADMEARIKRGAYRVIERQEKITFDELIRIYEQEGEKKDYILRVKQTYLDFFGNRKLSQIIRQDLFEFRDRVKATPKQRGGDWLYVLKCSNCGGEFEATTNKASCPSCSSEQHTQVKRKKRPVEVTDGHVNRIMAGLRRLFNFAVNRELMADTPFPKNAKSGLFYPEAKGLRKFFTEEQMNQIIDASFDWLRPMILTAYYTGMRSGEMLGLRWEHVDLEAGIIHLPSSKTLKDPSGLGQRIVMQKELIELFQGLPRRSEWVFTKADGTPYHHWDIHKPFRKLLRSLGIDPEQYSWKELRHTTATLMHLKGAEIKSIKDQLRHTTMKTTESFYIGSDVAYQNGSRLKSWH